MQEDNIEFGITIPGAERIDDIPSRPFGGRDWSEHANVLRLIDALFGEYAEWYKDTNPNGRIRDPAKIRQHLTHIVLEAFRTHCALPTLSMGVHLGNKFYNEGTGRYHPSHLSYRIVKNVTEFLVSAGHLEMPEGKGGWHPIVHQRRTTRFRATRRLVELCHQYGINRFMIVPYENPEVIVLRARKKRGKSRGDLIDYANTPFTRLARKNLERINSFISSHRIDLDITDDQEEALLLRLRGREDAYIDYTKTRLVRIFNHSFDCGGRYYRGWWQGIPSDQRLFITINGKRTVELDFSGNHFAIMYAQIGLDTPMPDPYALRDFGGHLRGNIKIALNIIINCSSREEAVAAIDHRIAAGELSRELVGGEHLLRAFVEAHPLIRDKIASGEGVRAQFVDSRVAECC